MKNKEKYLVEDFLEDSTFIHWVHQSNEKDIAFWKDWLGKNPQHQKVAMDARDIIKGIQFSPKVLPESKVNEALNQLNQKIKERSTHRKISFWTKRRRWIGAAACLILLLGLTARLFWEMSSDMIFHQTAFSEKMELALPDGTKVSLNANSQLKYDRENPRKVWLVGEAFFEVQKKPKTGENFLVHTDDLTVEVLGTAFNVHTRKEQTRVVLEEGKINLQLENGVEKEMAPGDLIAFSAKQNKILQEEKTLKTAVHTSWKDGNLLFEDISLKDAMSQIAEIYGVKVTYGNDTIAAKRIHIGVPTTNLEICIKAMEIACKVKIQKSDDELIINELK